ncbi:glycosyltransferase family 2 protein [Candidatus Woesearchaeota archaeon]|nr:glycosyltransferase family 2 protein [Candidatus Woesearchaeota archaeon]
MISNKDAWVIIPAYNEEKRIASVINKVKKYVDNVVVVDDGSKDDTGKVANKTGAFVLVHILNLGKGAGVKTGCDFALKRGAEKLILIDADGQHDADEIPRFLKALEEADVVFGSRGINKKMPWVFRMGNRFLNSMMGFLFGIKLKDTQCGYRAFTAEAYKKVKWRASDYSMESEMIANVGKRHLRYKEIPIETLYLDKYKGTTMFDGIKIGFNLIKWRLIK